MTPKTRIVSRRKHGFRVRRLHRHAQPHALQLLTQKTSFWIAAFSVIAYITGNMMGQYGWHTFWASVLGKTDDSLIVYTGTVSPLAQVPDYGKWAKYGGNAEEHSFSQVPKDALIPLPLYLPDQQRKTYEETPGDIYSIGHMGSYATGAEHSGSHVGVDIRTPVGTPVRSIAAGVVHNVREDSGYGKVIVVRHPNVPDPSDPKKTTTLYSVYAHLSAVLVDEGMVLQKGEQIALSGRTGFASGPHLHFQIDREEAPWHPYWPFTGAEQRAAGMSFTQAVDSALYGERGSEYTIHPMLYVQADHAPVRLAVASADPTMTVAASSSSARPRVRLSERIANRREERMAERLARRSTTTALTTGPVPVATIPEELPVVLSHQTVVTATPEHVPAPPPVPAAAAGGYTIEILHDGGYEGRGWETVRIRVADDRGETMHAPKLTSDLYLRTAFGSAEFRPAVLSEIDLADGTATVQMLPRGRQTVIVEVQPYRTLSRPMVYEGR